MTPEHHSCPDRVADLSARLLLSIAFVSAFRKEEDDVDFVSLSLLQFILSLLLTRLWAFILRCIKLIWSVGYGLSVRVRTVNNRWSSAHSAPLLPLYMNENPSASGFGFYATSQPSLRVRNASR